MLVTKQTYKPRIKLTVDELKLVDVVRQIFKLTPAGLIEQLNLRRPIYRQTAAFGHFGRNEPDFTWEKTDKADELKGLLQSA